MYYVKLSSEDSRYDQLPLTVGYFQLIAASVEIQSLPLAASKLNQRQIVFLSATEGKPMNRRFDLLPVELFRLKVSQLSSDPRSRNPFRTTGK